ncbi:TetR/AcrR family transcriptional regulator [Cupriavidus basilensis]|uniref:TetR/AcrR family transcriptional regulator n=1 Tax=Cupriavidus basilensis TaxID=68895 RepID=UPI0007515657|nr:TetR/AcrR family transcriptional regulator [Cupriavidus basilensis]
MRYSPEHKAETRKQIVEAAAAEFREHGIDGVGLAQLMKSAGLTHGGFYAHFDSRDALVADAVDAAFGQTTAFLEAAAAAAPARQRKRAILHAYMNRKHRDKPASGCAIAALGADVSRLDARTRKRFEAGVAALIELIAGDDSASSRKDAILMLATMVGGLVLARAVRSEALSTEILDTVQASR